MSEAHDLGAREEAAQPLGQFCLARVLRGEELALSKRGGHRLDHPLRRMPQDGRPVAQDIIDVDVAIDVVETGAVAAREEQRHGHAGVAHVAADAAGEMPFRPGIERDRLVVMAHASLTRICDHEEL